MPEWSEIVRLISLSDYNTRVVLFGCVALGIAAGMIGPFMMLRRRALMADAVSHAALPGIAIAFLFSATYGTGIKSLPLLLAGAVISGLMGMGVVLLIQTTTKLKQDAALGIVLSVFYGLGISLLGVIQKMSTGSAAGLNNFIYGKTASMLASDAQLIGALAIVIIFLLSIFYKEFKLLCFDEGLGSALGFNMRALDVCLMALVVVVTVLGLQAVGLILMIALLIIPPASAKFWSRELPKLILVSALMGALSCAAGVIISALYPDAPPGAVIVLCGFSLFVFSLLFGPVNGLIHDAYFRYARKGRIRKEHLLRALYEAVEEGDGVVCVDWQGLSRARTWSHQGLNKILKKASKELLVFKSSAGLYQLTHEGYVEAQQIVRNHRLWELYLIHFAAIAPNHVDRDADEIEHVLGRSMVDRLEVLLQERYPDVGMPASPHVLGVSPEEVS